MKDWLNKYQLQRPMFLSLIRAKEASLWAEYLPLKRPSVDIGTGDGFFAQTVFGKIDIGLDIAQSRMEEARARGVYTQLTEFDGQKIPLKSQSASTVVCNCVLEHVSDLNSLLAEVKRILKPNGTFIASVMAEPWETNLWGSKLLGSAYKKWMRKKQVHINLLSYDGWLKRFERSGFKIRKALGYLDNEACQWLDVSHYLSLPSLVSYKLTGSWTKLPSVKPSRKMIEVFERACEPQKAGAIFWVMTKQ